MHLCGMDFRFSDDFLKVLEFSRDEAVRTGWHNIGVDHVMLGILRHGDNDAIRVLDALGVDSTAFKCSIDEAVFVYEAVPWEERDSVHFCDSAVSMLEHASLEAARCKDDCIEPLHFLLAVSRMSGSYSHDWLDSCGISLRDLVKAAGIGWERYGLRSGDNPARPDTTDVMPDSIGHLPDPQAMAAAIEQRLLEGYTTDNPIAS